MLMLIFGTRPEAIKLGPVAAELKLLGCQLNIVCTGQHSDLLRGTPAESDLAGATSLGLASDGSVLRWLRGAERALAGPTGPLSGIVVVQGDTMSALAGARAAAEKGLVLAHVEAGVRSHRLTEPWPEEGFRVEIDRLADWYYAPTSTAFANLLAEGAPLTRIITTGNSVVSALARYAAATPKPPSDHCLVTMHRREWLEREGFMGVLDALQAAAREHPAARFIWPMHPAVAQRVGLMRAWFETMPSNFMVVAPLPYREAISVLSHAFGVLTDSGGLVEEAATLGVPSVQLRNVSDRPEAIEVGVSQLCPPTADGVMQGVAALCGGAFPRCPTVVYGGVDSAAKVARHLASLDAASTVPTPLEVN